MPKDGLLRYEIEMEMEIEIGIRIEKARRYANFCCRKQESVNLLPIKRINTKSKSCITTHTRS